MKERLSKILARAGVASRRSAEKLIESGAVSVNGKVVSRLPALADPERDVIKFKGKRVSAEGRAYILFNKPKGVMCTLKDPHSKNTLSQWIPKRLGRLYPVGRLDKNSTGLVFLTNDGDLANKIIHPRHVITKVYEVEVNGSVKAADIKRLEGGVTLDGVRTLPCGIKIKKARKDSTSLEFKLREGRKRQIRRMLKALGYTVKKLHRVGIGPLSVASIKPGKWRFLTADEIKRLKAEV